MNKKPFNEIEEQMKASAEGWEPAFDEQAWEHMQKMLDKEDDRRRPIAWWLWLLPVLLAVGVISYFMINREDEKPATATAQKEQNNITALNKENTSTTGVNNVEQTPVSNTDAGPANNNIASTTASSRQLPLLTNDRAATSPSRSGSNNRKARTTMNILSAGLTVDDKTGANKGTAAKIASNNAGKSKMTISASATTETSSIEDARNDKQAQPPPALQTDIKKDNGPVAAKQQPGPEADTTKASKEIIPVNKPPKKEEKERMLSRFYFGLSAGMDANGVNFPGLNKFTARAGFTAGYHLTKNLSVATGFFAGSKKYVAGKNDYKAKPGTYWAMVDIKEVEADCRVFEIPLWLRYDFSGNGKLKPFAMLGLSSFIMDKEDYDYYYYRMGNPYRSAHTYKGNQHLFSVLRIAGGVEKKISNHFSLSLQPGLSIPLSGVGEGQIKLYSTELLLGLKYRPFKKSK